MLTRWFISLIAGLIVSLFLVRYMIVYGPLAGTSSAFSLLVCIATGGLVFSLLLAVLVWPVLYVDSLARRANGPRCAANKALVKTDNAGWERTTVAHLENLKLNLTAVAKQVEKLAVAEVEVNKLRVHAGLIKYWFGKLGLAFLRKENAGAGAQAAELHYQIERIYRGDVDPEIADYREEIIQIQLEREPVDKDSFFAEFVIARNKNRDARIRRCERNIAELEQWRAKVSATNALVTATQSPHEATWRNFVDIANRTAAAPIIEARSRVEAAMTAIEAKRHYERLVSEQWRRGLLTDDEAEYIQQRIREEFLGAKHSIYE